MSDSLMCPLCAAAGEFSIVERVETVAMKGKSVDFTAQRTRCVACGGEFETPGQVDANLAAARDIYAARYEAPSSQDILSMRESYGASQKAFGLVLGLGELTINSYERGDPPAEPNRTLLRLARDPVAFRRLYALNKWKIGSLQRRRIEESPGFAAGTWSGLESLRGELGEEDSAFFESAAQKAGRSLESWCAEALIPCAKRSRLAPLPPAAWRGDRWVGIDSPELPEHIDCPGAEKVGA